MRELFQGLDEVFYEFLSLGGEGVCRQLIIRRSVDMISCILNHVETWCFQFFEFGRVSFLDGHLNTNINTHLKHCFLTEVANLRKSDNSSRLFCHLSLFAPIAWCSFFFFSASDLSLPISLFDSGSIRVCVRYKSSFPCSVFRISLIFGCMCFFSWNFKRTSSASSRCFRSWKSSSEMHASRVASKSASFGESAAYVLNTHCDKKHQLNTVIEKSRNDRSSASILVHFSFFFVTRFSFLSSKSLASCCCCSSWSRLSSRASSFVKNSPAFTFTRWFDVVLSRSAAPFSIRLSDQKKLV